MNILAGTSINSSATVALFVNGPFLFAGTNGNETWRFLKEGKENNIAKVLITMRDVAAPRMG